MKNKRMLNMMDRLETATAYRDEFGYSIIPVRGKIPVIQWQEYRERYPTDVELKEWFDKTRYSIAAVCGSLSNLTVLDADSPAAEDWVAENAFTEDIVRTPSGGFHYHFEYLNYPNKVNLLGIGLDVRSQGGLAVLPPSPGYKWVISGTRGKIGDVLPPIDSPTLSPPSSLLISDGKEVERTINYLKKLEPSISGQQGHKKAYRAACVVADRVRGLMLPEQALPILEEWNARCEPPWSAEELLHKLTDAWRR